MSKLKKISLAGLIFFYLVAGSNHFRNPESYIKIIPDYFHYPRTLNIVAGFFEILFAIMLVFYKTRKLAAYGIILMLIAFLPVHISMIAGVPLHLGRIVVTPLIAWIRLIILQPLLILWAWWYTLANG